jgi:hypothetical protein
MSVMVSVSFVQPTEILVATLLCQWRWLWRLRSPVTVPPPPSVATVSITLVGVVAC